MSDKISIGALISGGGSNLQAIIDSCKSNTIDGRVVFVGSDNPQAPGLNKAKEQGLPAFAVDYKAIIGQVRDQGFEALVPDDFELEKILAVQRLMPTSSDKEKLTRYFSTRAIAEAALIREMASRPFDLLVLAGFMRVLTPYFIDKINTDPSRPRMMNIHPALLPSFPGVDGYGDTYRYGCRVAGCTVHFVDYGEDSGPIIGQKAFNIGPEDTIESVRKRGLELEWELYPECIQLFAQNRLKVVSKTYTHENGTVWKRKLVKIGGIQ